MVEAAQEKLVVANWKTNLSHEQAKIWLQTITEQYHPFAGIKVILAAPFPFLSELDKQFGNKIEFILAAQDVSPYPQGSYTGSVPAALLKGTVDFVLVGHRERRKYFHETVQDVANKVTEALEEEITPILCVDMDIARQQAAAIELDEIERIIVAYTPADADQLEIPRNLSTIAEDIQRIASVFPGVPVLYGGGVSEKNVAELFAVPGLAGVMVAGGCLDPQAFVRLLENAGNVLTGLNS